MVMCSLRRAFFVFLPFSTTLYPQIGRRNGGVVLNEGIEMSIRLSLDISNLTEDLLGKFILGVEMVNPDRVMLDWAGRNPVCVDFKSQRPLEDEVRKVGGRYDGRLITVYTCFSDSEVMRIIIHEYAHHLQWLNHCAQTCGWDEFEHPTQEYLYGQHLNMLPSWAYARKNATEMAAEAFCLAHGHHLNWDAPVSFIQDWTLFFLEQPYFRDTF